MSRASQEKSLNESWPGVNLGQFWPRVATVIDCHVAWSRALNLLVDSGAQVTMCSKIIYDSLAPSCRPVLTSCGQPINAANGGQIKTYGTALFPLSVAGTQFSTEIIVADMGGIP